MIELAPSTITENPTQIGDAIESSIYSKNVVETFSVGLNYVTSGKSFLYLEMKQIISVYGVSNTVNIIGASRRNRASNDQGWNG